ncbi:MAG: NAD(P)/FAD-dependent oxidoreductase [Nocardia sp.]|nr:NAD(P)/FAD-dependent oxidoreductase [Nocardia sp.]
MTSATGAQLRGAQSFEGEMIHCVNWSGQRNLRLRAVAVIGRAADVARVLPPVVAAARRVTVFQTEPVWILPRSPVPAVAKFLPSALLRCAARANLRIQVRDSWVRRQLTPESATGIHRHNRYYHTLRRADCTLVTWPIARLAPRGIRTVDGIEHRVDTIIIAHTAGTEEL